MHGKEILIWSTGGYTGLLNVEVMIGLALKLRGYSPLFVICDGAYKACASRFDTPEKPMAEWSNTCAGCIGAFRAILERYGLPYTTISQSIRPEELTMLRNVSREVTLSNYRSLTYDGVSFGKTLCSALIRQLRGAEPGPEDEEMLKEFAFTVLCSAAAISNLITTREIGTVLTSHACYADWGPCLLTSLHRMIPIMTYHAGYVADAFIFSWCVGTDAVYRPVTDHVWARQSGVKLPSDMRDRLTTFLERRYKEKKAADMEGAIRDYRGDWSAVSNLNLDPNKPIWGVMTHINWDACGDYYPMVHSTFDEWVVDTIRSAIAIPEVQWLIKVHPAEESINPLTGAQRLIEKHFPVLPDHIKIVPFSYDVSPLDFLNSVDGIVTIFGTSGMEAACLGKPVILAGRPHYANHGFTYDANTVEDYHALLRRAKLFGRLSPQQQELAEKYCALFFIAAHVPLQVMKNRWDIDESRLAQLVPGTNKFIDFICERLTGKTDFVMPPELCTDAGTETGRIIH